MFDISWTEFLLIGVVALIVIGPKELPTVMRTLGQYTRKIRSMASDFQNQFHEAMREAEMLDLKKQVDDMAQGVAEDFSKFDPVKNVRENVVSIGKDFENSLSPPAEQNAAKPASAEQEPLELKPEAAANAAPALPGPALPEPGAAPAVPGPSAPAPAIAASTPEPVTAATEPESTERTG